MLQKEYKDLFDKIKPSPALIAQVLSDEKDKGAKSRQQNRPIQVLAAALSLCILLAIPALAVRNQEGYRILYSLLPEVAQFFVPVQETSVDNGIEMEVISAHIEGDTAQVYVTMRDLTANRVDETTDLFDSYSINTPFDSMGHCMQVGFDPQTKTATFLITISHWDKQKITGKKITFSVREFISGKKVYETVAIPYDFAEISKLQPSKEVASNGGGSSDQVNRTEVTVLVPGAPVQVLPVADITITAMGFIDNQLHIQAKYGDLSTRDNHANIYLQNGQGETVNCVYNAYFRQDVGGESVSYCEFVFDIGIGQLEQYDIFGDFYISNQFTRGNWQITFPISTK